MRPPPRSPHPSGSGSTAYADSNSRSNASGPGSEPVAPRACRSQSASNVPRLVVETPTTSGENTPACQHSPQMSRNRSGYASSARNPLSCSINVPHIDTEPITVTSRPVTAGSRSSPSTA